MNVLRHAGIVAGKPETGQTVWLGMPDGDCFSFAQENGLLEPAVDLGGAVAKGAVLARIHPIGRTGMPPVEICARMDGILCSRHVPGLINAGDCLAVPATLGRASGRERLGHYVDISLG